MHDCNRVEWQALSSGDIRPFNEYYLVAYLAYLADPAPASKASVYFSTYCAPVGIPPGDGTYPVHRPYQGYDLLTDNPNIFMSSFIPQFCYFESRGFHSNAYYSSILLPDWLDADMLFWARSLDSSSRIWGTPVQGKIFGLGAGPGPNGYQVERIEGEAIEGRPIGTTTASIPPSGSDDLVMSAHIMAGFLPVARTSALRDEINADLAFLYDNDVCAYTLYLPDGRTPKVLWRCSVVQEWWRAPSFDSIDFSTMVLGYATNFLPAGFYATYAF